MGGGDVPNNTTQSVTQQLPDYAHPYAVNLLERGYGLSNSEYQPYQGQRIADLTPEHQAGLSMTRDRALYGAPDVNAARAQNAYTSAGGYLTPESNPYLKGNVDAAMNAVRGQVNSQFNSAGGYGGSAHQEMLTGQLANKANEMYGANYVNERANQLRAAVLAPQFGQMDYADSQALLGVGDVYGRQQQNLLNQQYDDFQRQSNYPYQQLDLLSNALAGSTGGRSTTTQTGSPMQYSPAASALGGGLLGYGVGSMAQGTLGSYSPYVGAGLGALGGLFM